MQSPTKILSSERKKCNLLCSAEFEYKTGRPIVNFLPDAKSDIAGIMEFNYETNKVQDNVQSKVTRNEYDLKFNSEIGFVKKFEFYMPSIHKIDNFDPYDGELCIYHQDANGKTNMIVSVFLKKTYSFSVSQDFFQQLIPHIEYDDNETTESNIKAIEVSSTWSIYQALPLTKSFYVYRGTEPGMSVNPDNGDIIWLIMDNPVNIHYDEFKRLSEILPSKYTTEMSSKTDENYTIDQWKTHVLYYNDGRYITGSDEKGKVYVKCRKLKKSKVKFYDDTQELLTSQGADDPPPNPRRYVMLVMGALLLIVVLLLTRVPLLHTFLLMSSQLLMGFIFVIYTISCCYTFLHFFIIAWFIFLIFAIFISIWNCRLGSKEIWKILETHKYSKLPCPWWWCTELFGCFIKVNTSGDPPPKVRIIKWLGAIITIGVLYSWYGSLLVARQQPGVGGTTICRNNVNYVAGSIPENACYRKTNVSDYISDLDCAKKVVENYHENRLNGKDASASLSASIETTLKTPDPTDETKMMCGAKSETKFGKNYESDNHKYNFCDLSNSLLDSGLTC